MKLNTAHEQLTALKQIITDCIIYEEEEKERMQGLQLIHLREKHHYKMRAYRWILREMVRLEGK